MPPSIKTRRTPKTSTPSTASAPSFLAILSDIHGNIDALEAVQKDLKQWPVSGLLCLGDTVGYGAAPAACVQWVAESCALSVLGNHEALLLALHGTLNEAERNDPFLAPIRLVDQQLSAEQKAWIKDQALVADLEKLVLTHGSLNEPQAFDYLLNEETARAHFKEQRPRSVSWATAMCRWRGNRTARCCAPSRSRTSRCGLIPRGSTRSMQAVWASRGTGIRGRRMCCMTTGSISCCTAACPMTSPAPRSGCAQPACPKILPSA